MAGDSVIARENGIHLGESSLDASVSVRLVPGSGDLENPIVNVGLSFKLLGAICSLNREGPGGESHIGCYERGCGCGCHDFVVSYKSLIEQLLDERGNDPAK